MPLSVTLPFGEYNNFIYSEHIYLYNAPLIYIVLGKIHM